MEAVDLDGFMWSNFTCTQIKTPKWVRVGTIAEASRDKGSERRIDLLMKIKRKKRKAVDDQFLVNKAYVCEQQNCRFPSLFFHVKAVCKGIVWLRSGV